MLHNTDQWLALVYTRELSGSIKYEEAEQLLASQEGLSFMELVV
jgi:hypothetical protein